MTAAAELRRRIEAAQGAGEADLVIADVRALDLVTGETIRGDVAVVGDTIVGVGGDYRARTRIEGRGRHVVPGFVDAHCHVESSLVTPHEFEACVLPHGVTTAIWDPHEIANVLGAEGLRYALDGAERTVMDLRVALSSCVPATGMETSGARLEAADLAPFLDHPRVVGLAEVMNFPGVAAADPGLLAKLESFAGRHVDGHAPLLGGAALDAYLAAGISTDHECTTADEAREKLRRGCRILVREGSVSKDLAALTEIIDERTAPMLAFCTDDRNPLDIAEEGHIDHLIRTAIANGAPMPACYRMASWSAAQIFGLGRRGLVAPGHRADLVLLDDLEGCAVSGTITGGREVTGELLAAREPLDPVGLDSMRMPEVPAEALTGGPDAPVIGVVPGRIITERLEDARGNDAMVAVIERHGRTEGPNIGRARVRGFGLERGALASSVGHDSHNATVVGMDASDMALAANRLRALGGGFVVAAEGQVLAEIALPIAGLMSTKGYREVERTLRPLHAAARALGCTLPEPFLQVAFLPLPVIPHLKLTDRGLVDVDRFAFV